MRAEKGKIVIYFVGIIFLAAAAILGIFQYHWVNEASAAEENRLRRTMELSATHSLNSAAEEVTALLSSIYIEPEDVDIQRWDALQKTLDRWKDAASFPSVLKAIYYPGSSLKSAIALRRLVNLLLSVGVLTLMMISLVLLYGLFLRRDRLRARENEFVASMGHEFRTPITVIRAASDNLTEGAVTSLEQVRRYSGIIGKEVRRLSRMVEGILLFSGLQAAWQKPLQLQQVKLSELVKEITDSMQELVHENGAMLKVHLQSAPETIESDQTGLRLIIENFLSNAIKHGIPCNAKHRTPVEIRLKIQSRPFNHFRIVVEDEGSGIPRTDARKVFEPFFRLSDTVRSQKSGSGLGLHLVQRVARLLAGYVSLESPYRDVTGKIHTGCRFIADLPIDESRANG